MKHICSVRQAPGYCALKITVGMWIIDPSCSFRRFLISCSGLNCHLLLSTKPLLHWTGSIQSEGLGVCTSVTLLIKLRILVLMGSQMGITQPVYPSSKWKSLCGVPCVSEMLSVWLHLPRANSVCQHGGTETEEKCKGMCYFQFTA